MTTDRTILVIAKEPLPGRVKTRLTPPCTAKEAAHVAATALAQTLRTVADAPARRRVLALEGRPGPWLPPGFEVIPQVSGDLDERIAGAFAHVQGPVVLIGMDTPQLSPAAMACDFRKHPAWLGHAEDGGFWALGLAEPDPALVRGVPMSVPHTGRAQLRRLLDAGLTVGALPPLRDVDTWDDALHVAAAVPGTAFARVVEEISARWKAA